MAEAPLSPLSAYLRALSGIISKKSGKQQAHRASAAGFPAALSAGGGSFANGMVNLKEEIAKLEKEGKAAIQDSRALYQLWIQKLEDHYMALLRSDDYMNTLRET
ncbi:MAG TPA: hypothetical protein PL037_03820, partial [Elusimicrobiales bacterium]|nr:hypothetical protein [Elusimicrobiales bacterium]